MSLTRATHWICWTVVVVLGLAIVAGVIGGVASYAATRRGFAHHPAPGRLYTVVGHRLHLYCTGAGAQTVVFESALGGWSIDWGRVQSRLPPTVRACSYDRAGYGWSDPSHRPYTPEQVARELHSLLHVADVPGPYVLVGHSVGGIYVRQFAHLYPGETAGLVFVDSTHEQMLRRFPPDAPAVKQVKLLKTLRIVRFGAITGVTRLMHTPVANLPDLEGEQRAIAQAIGYRFADYDAFYNESAAYVTASEDSNFVPPSLPHVPLVVLTSRQSLEKAQTGPVWRVLQGELANLVPNSRHLIIDSGHFIQVEKPEAVVDAIVGVLRATATPNR